MMPLLGIWCVVRFPTWCLLEDDLQNTPKMHQMPGDLKFNELDGMHFKRATLSESDSLKEHSIQLHRRELHLRELSLPFAQSDSPRVRRCIKMSPDRRSPEAIRRTSTLP